MWLHGHVLQRCIYTPIEYVIALYFSAQIFRTTHGIYRTSVVHTMSAPLTCSLSTLHQLKNLLATAPHNTTAIMENVDHLQDCLDQLLFWVQLLHAPCQLATQATVLDLKKEMSMIEKFVHPIAAHHHVHTIFSTQSAQTFTCTRQAFLLTVLPLIINAIDAVKHRTAHQRWVKVVLNQHPHHITVTISDHGHGLSPHKKIQTDRAGIGLHLVRYLVKRRLGGTLTMTTLARHGTTVIVTLPITTLL